ncbi:MAG: hypothetical protein HQL66_03310 [Magnetococcales bacterium]|nr:hypothetical protein [Magnetococcales bacterium]
MSTLDDIQSLVAATRPTQGVVTAVGTTYAIISTPSGGTLVPAGTLAVGDRVRLGSGQAMRTAAGNGKTFYV